MTTTSLAPSPPAHGTTRTEVGRNERVLSLLGGALLAYAGLRTRRLGGRLGLLAGSGALVQHGLARHSWLAGATGRDGNGSTAPLEIRTSFTVQQPRRVVYDRWCRFEEFPRFMEHLERIEVDGDRSHWVAPVPGLNRTIEWDTRTTQREPGRRIAWSSLPDASVDNAGEVRFADAPGGRGTEVHVRILYRAPAGTVGSLAAGLLNPAFRQMVEEDVRRFKQVCEAGERPTIAGQPQGGRR